MYIELGCIGDILTLGCTGTGTISVTRADWGKLDRNCDIECCPPNPSLDCTVDIQTSDPEYFDFLKLQCDSYTSCSFNYTGRTIDECQANYSADYMQVFYDCISNENTGPVAFTAKVPNSYSDLSTTVVRFTQILTNFGGHFNSKTSSFVCPFDGVYLFFTHICTRNDYLRTELRKGADDVLTYTISMNELGGAENIVCGSPTIVSECYSGETVYVTTDSSGLIFSDFDLTLFTGALLYRF